MRMSLVSDPILNSEVSTAGIELPGIDVVNPVVSHPDGPATSEYDFLNIDFPDLFETKLI